MKFLLHFKHFFFVRAENFKISTHFEYFRGGSTNKETRRKKHRRETQWRFVCWAKPIPYDKKNHSLCTWSVSVFFWRENVQRKKKPLYHTQIDPLDQESRNNMTFKFSSEIWKTIIFEQVSLFLLLFFPPLQILFSFVFSFVCWCLERKFCVFFSIFFLLWLECMAAMALLHFWSSLSSKTLLIAQSVRTKELAKKVSLRFFFFILPPPPPFTLPNLLKFHFRNGARNTMPSLDDKYKWSRRGKRESEREKKTKMKMVKNCICYEKRWNEN